MPVVYCCLNVQWRMSNKVILKTEKQKLTYWVNLNNLPNQKYFIWLKSYFRLWLFILVCLFLYYVFEDEICPHFFRSFSFWSLFPNSQMTVVSAFSLEKLFFRSWTFFPWGFLCLCLSTLKILLINFFLSRKLKSKRLKIFENKSFQHYEEW